MQEIIDFILKQGIQIKIEGQYTVIAEFVYGKGVSLEDAFNNWLIKYEKSKNQYMPIRDRKIMNTLEQF